MNNWREVTLGDCVSILGDGLHGTPKYCFDGKCFFINGNNLQNGKIVVKSDTKKVDDNEALKYKKNLNNRTILVSINGTLGNVAFYNEENIMLGKSACYFNVKIEVSKKFIFYVVKSKIFQNYLQNNSTGTTIKNVSLKQMRDYSFPLPPIDIQERIAAVLSALDDKMEINQQINNNLEQQAQAIFKSWFVDFDPFGGTMPDDWKKYALGEFLPVITGKKNANVSSSSGAYPFFSCSQTIAWTDDYSFDAHAILVAGNGDFNVKFYKGKFEAYQRTYVLIPYESNYTDWLYYAVKHNLSDITSAARGSVISFITKGNLENFEFAAPKNLSTFEPINTFKSINKQILHNLKENERLASIRDTLLPKLMNGEIDVSNVDISKLVCADKLSFTEEE